MQGPTLAEHQSKAGKGRMKQLNKKQRIELARKAGRASAEARRVAKKYPMKVKSVKTITSFQDLGKTNEQLPQVPDQT